MSDGFGSFLASIKPQIDLQDMQRTRHEDGRETYTVGEREGIPSSEVMSIGTSFPFYPGGHVIAEITEGLTGYLKRADIDPDTVRDGKPLLFVKGAKADLQQRVELGEREEPAGHRITIGTGHFFRFRKDMPSDE